MTKGGEFTEEDYVARDRWCGYCGRKLLLNLPEFFMHLDKCERDSGKEGELIKK